MQLAEDGQKSWLVFREDPFKSAWQFPCSHLRSKPRFICNKRLLILFSVWLFLEDLLVVVGWRG